MFVFLLMSFMRVHWETNTQQSLNTMHDIHTHNNSIFNPALLFLFTYMCYAKQSAEVEVECIYSCGVPNINIYLFVWHESMSWRVSELRKAECVCVWERERNRHIQTVYVYQIRHSKYVFMCDLIVHRVRERKRPETVKFN